MNIPVDQKAEEGGAVCLEPPLMRRPFSERTDWQSFALTALAALAVYLYCAAPEVTLENSGMLASAAMYGGVGNPPGYPVWCIYSWFFIKLVPFSNIAWRVGVGSAVAASLTCGLVAFMVSQGSGRMIRGIWSLEERDVKEARLLRIAAGFVAGIAFGFDSVFWETVGIIEVWPLTLLSFAVVVCLLLRWQHAPEQRRYLYAACFTYGLALCNSEALVVALFGFELFVLFTNPAIGRDLLLVTILVIAAVLLVVRIESIQVHDLRSVFVWCGFFAALVAGVLVVVAGAAFTEWRIILACGAFLTLGLLPYLYLPIASMTNPPMNWGYPRTVEGFIHVLARGQYARVQTVESFWQYFVQMVVYAKQTAKNFGVIYMALALVPFWFVRRVEASERRLMFGLSGIFMFVCFFWVAMLNFFNDRAAINLYKEFFAPSHLILAIWAGYGLVLVGMRVVGAKIRVGIGEEIQSE
ncbi:MAG: hypothetical protein JWR26_2020 [Pedosphaera sp.]|nr:hypothetical protein [Pedosphaera sp.]